MDRRQTLRAGSTWAIAGLSGALAPVRARAAEPARNYPTRPVTLVVPYGAGSSTDILTRVVAQQMSVELGQNVIVENRAGAGGTLGSNQVARSAPDGHTLVMGTISSHSINASMMRNIPYDVLRDFSPVSLVAHFPNVLAVNRNLPVGNLRELVELSKQRGGLDFATGGVGSSGQMAGELLKLRTGAKLVHVPYKDIGQGITDTVAGHVPMVFYQVPALVSHIQAGQLKALAVFAPRRTPLLPTVPTPAEQGIDDFDATAWMGLFGPARLPAGIQARLHDAVVKATRNEAVREKLTPQGFTLVGSDAGEFQKFLQADIAKWARVIKATGAVID